MLGGEMATDFFAGGGIKLERALVPIAANCSKNPEVTNAAAGTFLQEGREAAVRCGLHGGPHCGTKHPFAAPAPTTAFPILPAKQHRAMAIEAGRSIEN